MKFIQGKVTSKKGFYVGDPCYVLSEANYHGVFGGNGYNCDQFTGTTADGKKFDFIMNNTAYGDGSYSDNYGNVYGVDAGIIGVVPVELCVDKAGNPLTEAQLNDLGHYFPGTEADFTGDDGVFDITIGTESIHIDTGDEEEWPEYEDEWDEYDEYPEDDEDDWPMLGDDE